MLTEGAAPAGDQEVMLAVSSAGRIGVGVGDELTLTGPLGPRAFRVSGLGFVPAGPHNDYDEGGVVGDTGYDRLFPPGPVQVPVRPDHPQGRAPTPGGHGPGQRRVPARPGRRPARTGRSSSQQMRGVQPLPIALAVFLGLLALGAVAHALVTTIRRRKHEMAVLRACGMTRRQSRWVRWSPRRPSWR